MCEAERNNKKYQQQQQQQQQQSKMSSGETVDKETDMKMQLRSIDHYGRAAFHALACGRRQKFRHRRRWCRRA